MRLLCSSAVKMSGCYWIKFDLSLAFDVLPAWLRTGILPENRNVHTAANGERLQEKKLWGSDKLLVEPCFALEMERKIATANSQLSAWHIEYVFQCSNIYEPCIVEWRAFSELISSILYGIYDCAAIVVGWTCEQHSRRKDHHRQQQLFKTAGALGRGRENVECVCARSYKNYNAQHFKVLRSIVCRAVCSTVFFSLD